MIESTYEIKGKKYKHYFVKLLVIGGTPFAKNMGKVDKAKVYDFKIGAKRDARKYFAGHRGIRIVNLDAK